MYEEDKSLQFLMGLSNDEFSNIRSQILAQELQPHLDTIFNMVMHDENHKKVMTQQDGKTKNMIVFAVNMSKASQNLERPTCKHSNKYRHDE